LEKKNVAMIACIPVVLQCFWRNILLPSSRLKGKPSKKEAGK
jgi:hypothetical protein